MRVVILNGGKGTRLGLTDRPKPMVTIGGRPLLERLVGTARASGYRDFLFLNGHLGDVIEAHFGDGSGFGVRIQHVQEAAPLGTAGAIADARGLLPEPFLVMYGDILLDVDLAHFEAFFRRKGGLGALFVHPNDHPEDSDLVEAGEDGRILRFWPKPHPPGEFLPNLVSAALYILDPDAVDYVKRDGASDWGRDVFPAIVGAGLPLHAYRSLEYAKDMGTPARVARGEADLASGRVARLSRRAAKPAVFLDRDGVLNHEINGVHRPEDLALIDGAGAAVRRLNQAGIPAICVTNQPDVAKGILSPAALKQVFAALDTKLAQHGAYLDDIYFCPHHPERGWAGEVTSLKVVCDCRKPKPGLLLRAALDHHLDLGRSWMVGDRYVDVVAAQAAGAKAMLVRTGYGGTDATPHDSPPAHQVQDVAAAVAYILDAMA